MFVMWKYAQVYSQNHIAQKLIGLPSLSKVSTLLMDGLFNIPHNGGMDKNTP